jgi:hypothetical protein
MRIYKLYYKSRTLLGGGGRAPKTLDLNLVSITSLPKNVDNKVSCDRVSGLQSDVWFFKGYAEDIQQYIVFLM